MFFLTIKCYLILLVILRKFTYFYDLSYMSQASVFYKLSQIHIKEKMHAYTTKLSEYFTKSSEKLSKIKLNPIYLIRQGSPFPYSGIHG